MIEAVNSVLSNASYTKVAVEQQSVARSYAANPQRVQEAPQAPYISPYVVMDVNFDKAVLQLRDADTGDVVRQIPTESQLEAYKRAQAAATQKSTNKANAEAPAPSSPEINVASSSSTSAVVSTPSPTVIEASTSQTSPVPQAGNIVSVDTQA